LRIPAASALVDPLMAEVAILTVLSPKRVLSDVLARLIYLRSLSGAALQIAKPGVPRDRLRASVLATRVADALGLQDSPWFRRDLTAALRAVGWRSVKTDQIRRWKGWTI
jgi:hypothetical protein